MLNFMLDCILWTLALYGLIDIIKIIIGNVRYKRIESDDILVIIAAKNQEHQIEGFIRSVIFRILYGKEEYLENIFVTDLNSIDNTQQILKNLSKDYSEIKFVSWNDCKKILDNIDNT